MTFNDVLEIKNGRNQKAVENPNGKYPIYGSGGIIGRADDYICDAQTVVIGRKGSINNPIFVEEPFWNVDTAFGLTAKKEILNPRYLYFFCKNYDFEKLNKTVTIPSLTKADLLKVDIELPSLEDQSSIVQKLLGVQEIVRLRSEEINKLDDLIKARFVEMFGDPEANPKKWVKKPLSEMITTANNGMARRGNDELGNIVMRLVELQDGYIDYTNPNRIILTDTEKKRYLLKDRDFLFARVNGNPDNVGRCAVFTDIGEPVYHNDHIIRVHFDDNEVDGAFVSTLLNSTYGKNQLKKQIKTSAGQYTVNQDGIGAIVAILPPIELQRKFAALTVQVDKSKAVIRKALNKAQQLFDSLTQQYFG